MYVAVPADVKGKIPFELSHFEGRGASPEEAVAALEAKINFAPERIVVLNTHTYVMGEVLSA